MKILLSLNEIRQKFNLPEDAEIVIADEIPKKSPDKSSKLTNLDKWNKLLRMHQREKLDQYYPNMNSEAWTTGSIIDEISCICTDLNLDSVPVYKCAAIDAIFAKRELDPKPFWRMIHLI
jgi:hypothetical protein